MSALGSKVAIGLAAATRCLRRITPRSAAWRKGTHSALLLQNACLFGTSAASECWAGRVDHAMNHSSNLSYSITLRDRVGDIAHCPLRPRTKPSASKCFCFPAPRSRSARRSSSCDSPQLLDSPGFGLPEPTYAITGTAATSRLFDYVLRGIRSSRVMRGTAVDLCDSQIICSR
jgi:hypothetical protein